VEEEQSRLYEMIVIANPTMDDDGFSGIVEKVKELVKTGGGEILISSLWGKRKLAYEIKKFKRAYYALLQFKLSAVSLKEVERKIKLDEGVLRHLTILIKPEMLMSADMASGPEELDSPGHNNRGR